MKNTRSIILWFWRILQRLRFQATLNALIGILSVGLDFAFIWATKYCIDVATTNSEESLRGPSILLILILAAQMLLSFSRRWISALLGVKAQNQMQLALFQRLLHTKWNGRDALHSGDVLNRLVRDVNDVTSVITETLPSSLSVITRLVGAFFFLYTMDAMLACIIIAILPAFMFFSRLYISRMRKITREVRDTDSVIQSILQESIQHHIILKTLERIGTMTMRLNDTQRKLRTQVRRRTVFSSISGTLLNLGFATGYLVTFLWGANRLHEGAITYGMMIAFIQLVGQIQGPFRQMTKFVPAIISSFTAGERLMELEDAPIEEEGPSIYFTEGAGLRFNNVSFSYNEHERHILRNFSFDFPPGSSTAILGETGSGKTTLIRLILALLKPTEGVVKMYHSTHSTNVSPLTRCNLVYVPQDNTLFSGTIRNNLLLGNPDATEDEMLEALQTACADFVLKLPDGLDSRIGENGTGLSQGQAQRISIARALLRNGSILLLDEATSALDTDTETRLLKNLTSWIRTQHTLLFVTHRLAVVEHCTQVLKLEKIENSR